MSVQFAIDSRAGTNESLVDVTKAVSNFACPGNAKSLYSFIGLYDGFNGPACAKHAAGRLHEEMTKSPAFHSGNVLKAIEEGFQSTDRLFVGDAIVKKDHSAAAATVALIEAQAERCVLYVANAGDGRAVVCHGGQPVLLTEDHLATNSVEADRIVEWGGQVFDDKVMGQCHLARAFGCQKLKDLVIPDPFIRERVVQEGDEFVLLATAPFWAAFSDSEAVAKASELLVTHNYNIKAVCQALVAQAAPKRPGDSVSVALIFVHPNPQSLEVPENSTAYAPGLKPQLSLSLVRPPTTPGIAAQLSPTSGSTVGPVLSGSFATAAIVTPRSPGASAGAHASVSSSQATVTPRTPGGAATLPATQSPSTVSKTTLRSSTTREEDCRKCKGKGERRPYFGLFGHTNSCKSCNGSGKVR